MRRTSRRREGRSGTLSLGREFGCSLVSQLIDKVVDLLFRPQGHVVATFDIVEAFPAAARSHSSLALSSCSRCSRSRRGSVRLTWWVGMAKGPLRSANQD